MPASRPLALALATFVAGLAAGWFLWHGETPAVEPASSMKKSAAPGPTLQAATPSPAESADAFAEGVRDPPRPTGDRAAASFAAAYPFLDVRIVDAEGRPSHESSVYALPAKAPGTDDETASVLGWADESGETRLWFPAAGVYDVGATSGPAHALATDVAVPTTEPLLLRMPRTATVRVTVDASALAAISGRPDGDRPLPRIRFEPVFEGTAFEFPGRGDELKAWPSVSLTERDAALEPVVLLAGRRYRANVLIPPRGVALSVLPTEVVAPADVRVSATGKSVRLHLSLVPAFTSPTRARLALDFRVGDEVVGAEVADDHAWNFEPGEDAKLLMGTVILPTNADSVRWEGVGVQAGSGRVGVGTDGLPVLEGIVTVTGALLPLPDPPAPSSVEVVAPPAEVAELTLCAFRAQDDWDAAQQETWDPAQGRGVFKVPPTTALLIAFGDPRDDGQWEVRYVSPPRRGTDPIELVRAGFAVVVPEASPPPGVSFRVARADGHPFQISRELTSGPAAAEAGAVVGPLEPGTIRFRVFLAGVEVGEASVVVRADAHAPLVLRPSSGRPAPR